MANRNHPTDDAMPVTSTVRTSGGVATKGRGATFNPANRFRREQREAVDDGWAAPAGMDSVEDDPPRLKTIVRIQPARVPPRQPDQKCIRSRASCQPRGFCIQKQPLLRVA